MYDTLHQQLENMRRDSDNPKIIHNLEAVDIQNHN